MICEFSVEKFSVTKNDILCSVHFWQNSVAQLDTMSH